MEKSISKPTIKTIQSRVTLVLLSLTLSFSPTLSWAQVTITIAPLFSGVSEPADITHSGDGSGRLFIIERIGRIRIWDGTALLATPFLDITALTTPAGERGLLGMAFHPQYSANGRFFIHYTDLSGDTVLAAYRVGLNADQADAGSATVLLQIPQPFNNHNGGQIRFGPDGFLYMAVGDGGSGGDPQNNAQNLNSLLGKILRIDVDGASPYAIPGSNPFVGIANTQPEIWAYGLRNPWRFSFDRLTGDLFIGDVGQGQFEEIDLQPASSIGGENYGWRLMEGFSCFNPPTGCNSTGNLILPILEYDHTTGFSVTGGFVYRGTLFPDLAGHYIFADFSTGRIFIAESQGGGLWAITSSMDTSLLISAFGEDEAGEIYLAHFNAIDGAIYEISSASTATSQPSPAATPAAGSDNGGGGGGGGGGCFIHSLTH